MKEAYALYSGKPEKAQIASRAGERFRREHVELLCRELGRRLAYSGIPHLKLLADVFRARIGTKEEPSEQASQFPILAVGQDNWACGEAPEDADRQWPGGPIV